MKEIRVLLIGVGGYGMGYAREMLEHGAEKRASIAGVVDPYAASSPVYQALKDANVRFYDSVEAFYAADSADLAVVSTPIQFHARQSVYCMEHGSHVLCEKPAAATVELVNAMIDARDRTGKTLAIGFQWCYDEAMLRLKADVDAGALGRPVKLKGIVLWPRDIAYYKRGLGWAGKKYAQDGSPIFDSVASNATAHYLENMLWLTGRGFTGASIADMDVRTVRANDIETFDTIAMDARLDNGARLFYVASHATGRDCVQNPLFIYEFEKAIVTFGGLGETGDALKAVFRDGAVKDYGASTLNGWNKKLDAMIAAARGEAVTLPCPAEAARCHTAAMEMIREKNPEAEALSGARVDEGMVWVSGLGDRLKACFEKETLDF